MRGWLRKDQSLSGPKDNPDRRDFTTGSARLRRFFLFMRGRLGRLVPAEGATRAPTIDKIRRED